MGGIFVSYRRVDSSGAAGRLFDRLTNRFGRAAVCMDVEGGIPRGRDFSAAISEALSSADALVVVIGPAGCRALMARGIGGSTTPTIGSEPKSRKGSNAAFPSSRC